MTTRDGSECHLLPKVTFRTVPFVICMKRNIIVHYDAMIDDDSRAAV